MKTLDLKRGFQGQIETIDGIVQEVVNSDALQPSLQLDLERVGQLAYVEQSGERQYQRAFELLDGVCSRASGATNVEWDFTNGGVVGQLVEVGDNALRWNEVAGLFEEASSTNTIRNPRGEGFAAGDISGAGALPTNWAGDAQGATITVDAASGYANGSPRTRLRFSGTPTGDPIIWFEAVDTITAADAEDWCASLGAAIAAGNLTNVTAIKIRIQELTSGGAEVATEDLTLDDLDAIHRRFFLAHTLDGGGTTVHVRFGIVVDWDGSGAVDLTLDLFTPQLEQAAAPSSPILPVIGTPAATTRATETITALASVTRASRKSNAGEWDFTNGGAVGAYREFLPNAPAITGKGLLVEEATTNQIRNPRAEGAAAGTPGTLPTNWLGNAAGSTQEVVGSGYENGWSYVDIRFSGTPTGDPIIRFESVTQITAAVSQTWTNSVGVKVVAGDQTNINGVFLRIEEYDGGVFQAFNTSSVKAISSAHTRLFHTVTLGDADTDAAVPAILIDWDGSGAIDITLRIYAPQLEQKAYPTSPILPPKGNPGAATRAADDIEVGNGAWSNDNGAGSLYVRSTLNTPYTSGNFGWLGAGYGADSANSIRARASASFSTVAVDGGVTQASLQGPTITGAGQTITAAFSWNTDDFASSYNGETQQTDTSGSVGFGPAKLLFGTGGSGLYPSQYVEQVRYFPRLLTSAERETLVGN